MKKYLELFKDGFDSTVAEKTKVENWPYVGYSPNEGVVVYTVILEENQSGYQMIDLGLPSGLKWADRNVGAETPQDAGLYFSWGNVDGHAVDENGNVTDGYSFDKNTYATTSGGQYTGSELDAEHDAATYNMGEGWYMPTSAEIDELMENTDHYYIDEEGNKLDRSELSGSKLRSICFVKKGEAFDYNNRSNFIEIPFAGYCANSLLREEGSQGEIWSGVVDWSNVKKAFYLFFISAGLIQLSAYNRAVGLPVRGVRA